MKFIFSPQQACMIPGVSEKMALKIVEIIEFGKLGKVDEIVDEKTKILDVFCKVWGVGPSTADAWHAQGFRNLEDLRDKGKLTRQQEIGLMLYDDFQKRIPRNEVVEIYEIVKKGVNKIQGSLKVELVGSFRRGKAHCGDVDLMIVNHGPRNPGEILIQLTDALRGQGKNAVHRS